MDKKYSYFCHDLFFIALATLLVYDLPWILQGNVNAIIMDFRSTICSSALYISLAAWKIIKSWLDEQAVKKIK